MIIEIPTSIGDLFDRISILEIKRQRLDDPLKRDQAARELDLLRARRDGLGLPPEPFGELGAQLDAVNRILWEVEDALRECEQRRDFGERFVDLARQVYLNNDRRYALKAEIDQRSGSEIREQKGYIPYRRQAPA